MPGPSSGVLDSPPKAGDGETARTSKEPEPITAEAHQNAADYDPANVGGKTPVTKDLATAFAESAGAEPESEVMFDGPNVPEGSGTEKSPVPWYFAGPRLALNLASSFVQRLLFRDSVSVVFGQSTAGKSFWLLDLAFHVAMGWAWRELKVARGAVVYICLEGESGFRKRIVGYCQKRGINEEVPIIVRCIPLNLVKRGPNEIIEWVRNEVAPTVKAKWNIPVNWIIVDTLSQDMAGEKEDNETFSLLVSYGRKIASELQVETTFVHHPGKNFDNGSRGGYSLKANINSEFEIRKEDGYSVVTANKVKDGKDGAEYPFKLEVVELQDADGFPILDQWGDVLTTCTIEQIHNSNVPEKKNEPGAKTRAGFMLASLRHLIRERGIYRTQVENPDRALPSDRPFVKRDDWQADCAQRGIEAKVFRARFSELKHPGKEIVKETEGYVWLS